MNIFTVFFSKTCRQPDVFGFRIGVIITITFITVIARPEISVILAAIISLICSVLKAITISRAITA